LISMQVEKWWAYFKPHNKLGRRTQMSQLRWPAYGYRR
jgi:hypothetical protein